MGIFPLSEGKKIHLQEEKKVGGEYDRKAQDTYTVVELPNVTIWMNSRIIYHLPGSTLQQILLLETRIFKQVIKAIVF